jgi:hypothetical protein
MGSVITFRISETSAEEGETAPAALSSTSCTFVFTGDILANFRFLGAESFGSATIFCFLMAFWSSLIDRMVCLSRILTILFLFAPGPSIKSLVIWVLKIQSVHHTIQPSFLAGAKGSCHQLIFFLRIIPENFVAHRFYQLQPFNARFAESLLEFKLIRKSNKFILLSFLLFLRHSPTTRGWKRLVRQVFLHQVPGANVLGHNSKLHLS